MKITEFGQEHKKIFMLLPGTSCTWETNFNLLVEPLAKQFHVLCVNYTGFDGSTEVFDTQMDETERIENYVITQHEGHLDAVYGSSMGGSFASLLAQRKRIHIDHVFIGSSDLDQASPFVARLETILMGTLMKWMSKHPEKAMSKFSKVADAKGMSISEEDLKGTDLDDDYMQYMMKGFFETISKVDPKSVTNQFYSDLVTRLDDGIDIAGTTVHVFHSEKMGEKYLKRYFQHYAKPDIIPFNSGHEGWLGNPELMIDTFNKAMAD